VPAQNLLYADVDGNIGYQMPGDVPIRKKGAGVDGSSSRRSAWRMRAAPSTIAARTPLVPTSITSTLVPAAPTAT